MTNSKPISIIAGGDPSTSKYGEPYTTLLFHNISAVDFRIISNFLEVNSVKNGFHTKWDDSTKTAYLPCNAEFISELLDLVYNETVLNLVPTRKVLEEHITSVLKDTLTNKTWFEAGPAQGRAGIDYSIHLSAHATPEDIRKANKIATEVFGEGIEVANPKAKHWGFNNKILITHAAKAEDEPFEKEAHHLRHAVFGIHATKSSQAQVAKFFERLNEEGIFANLDLDPELAIPSVGDVISKARLAAETNLTAVKSIAKS